MADNRRNLSPELSYVGRVPPEFKSKYPFGEILKLYRQILGLKQIKIACELNITQSYLSEIENGRRPISIEVLARFAEFNNIRLSDLVYVTENIQEAKAGRIFAKDNTRHPMVWTLLTFVRELHYLGWKK